MSYEIVIPVIVSNDRTVIRSYQSALISSGVQATRENHLHITLISGVRYQDENKNPAGLFADVTSVFNDFIKTLTNSTEAVPETIIKFQNFKTTINNVEQALNLTSDDTASKEILREWKKTLETALQKKGIRFDALEPIEAWEPVIRFFSQPDKRYSCTAECPITVRIKQLMFLEKTPNGLYDDLYKASLPVKENDKHYFAKPPRYRLFDENTPLLTNQADRIPLPTLRNR